MLPVDLSGPAPSVGAAVPAGVTSGGIAICNGMGYVTDQWSGDVVRFDPTGIHSSSKATVCPVNGYAWAADVACAP